MNHANPVQLAETLLANKRAELDAARAEYSSATAALEHAQKNLDAIAADQHASTLIDAVEAAEARLKRAERTAKAVAKQTGDAQAKLNEAVHNSLADAERDAYRARLQAVKLADQARKMMAEAAEQLTTANVALSNVYGKGRRDPFALVRTPGSDPLGLKLVEAPNPMNPYGRKEMPTEQDERSLQMQAGIELPEEPHESPE